MMQFSSSFAVLGALALLAHADIAPGPQGFAPTYKVEVLSMPTTNDAKLVIFPWSMSNGVPQGEIKFVSLRKTIEFGRRIAGGRPRFWAIPADKVSEAKAKLRDPGSGFKTSLLEDWLKTPGNAIQCSGAAMMAPRWSARDSDDENFVDRFVVKSLDATQCTIEGPPDTDNKYSLEADVSADARQASQGVSASWVIGVMALAAVSALVWRLSSLLEKSSRGSPRDLGSDSPTFVE